MGQLSNVVEQLLHNIGFALLLRQFHNAILVLHWFYIDFTAQWVLHWFYTTFTRNRNHICVVIIVHRRLCRSRSTTMHLRVRTATVCNNGRRLRGRGPWRGGAMWLGFSWEKSNDKTPDINGFTESDSARERSS